MSPRRRIIPVVVPHLGCPHDCVFCNQKRISGHVVPASAETVTQAIRTGTGISGAGCELAFYGGSFTAIPAQEQETLLAAALPFLHSGALSSIRVSTRPDAINTAGLERLRRFGVGTVELGAQSMADSVLRTAGRGHTTADTRNAVKLLRESGFSVILQMMTGLPGSSDVLDMETARQIAALRPDGVRIYPTVVIRDTALWELWRTGAYQAHTVEDAVRVCAEILPLFETAGIPVIRLGLNPTDELSGGIAVAGAYHPALGELVRSRILLQEARRLLVGTEPGSRVILGVPPRFISPMAGQHRDNIRTLTEEFGLRELKLRSCGTENEKIVLLSVAKDGSL
jgi:histone acetyltransferase (RNA polymerase elongator complex component)